MMDNDSRQILLMLTWLFLEHGRDDKALVLAETLREAFPQDPLCASLYARLAVEDGRPEEALAALQQNDFPPSMRRLQALLTARALKALGRPLEGKKAWNDYLRSRPTGKTARPSQHE